MTLLLIGLEPVEGVCPAKRNAETMIGTRADPSKRRYRAFIPTPSPKIGAGERRNPSTPFPECASSNAKNAVLRIVSHRPGEGGPRLLERAELDDVAPEEQRHRPVQDDPHLAVEGGDAEDVVRAMQEPGREPPEPEPGHTGDALEPAERHQPAEALVAKGPDLPAPKRCHHVPRQPSGLPEGMLGGRWADAARREVGHGRAIARRPRPLRVADPKELVHYQTRPLVEREAQTWKEGMGSDPGRPDQRVRLEGFAVRQQHPAAFG